MGSWVVRDLGRVKRDKDGGDFFFENIFNKSLTVNYEIIHERSSG